MFCFRKKTPPRQPRIIIHIGTHKTGTTSIQKYLLAHRPLLESLGFAYYESFLRPWNHLELHLLCQRRDRGSIYKFRHPELDYDRILPQARESIAAFLRNPSRAHTLIFSAESLSYLRHTDEIEALKALFTETSPHVEIVLYLRKKEDFLASYINHFQQHNIPLSSDPGAFNYVEKDSWLLDYSALTKAYREIFPKITLMNYDEACLRHGDSVRSFLSFLGCDPEQMPDTEDYRFNPRNRALESPVTPP